MELYAKQMLTDTDMQCTRSLLLECGLHPLDLQPERISIAERAITTKQFQLLRASMAPHGFELVPEQEGTIVMTIKSIIIEQVQNSSRERPLSVNFTAYISYKLNRAYTQLSHIFSTVEGMTIKQFIILQKTEKAKELLHEDMPLAKVANRLSYSSVQHLSAQFKKITGVTPVQFRDQHGRSPYRAAHELTVNTCEL